MTDQNKDEWKNEEWKIGEAMEPIHITERMQEEILENVLARQRARKPVRRNIGRALATAAVILLVTCFAGVPVRAWVSNLLMARMERIPKEELDALVDELNSAHPEAAKRGRKLTEGELRRWKELKRAYLRGRLFPQKKYLQVMHEEDVVPGKLCYVRETLGWHLPERELTDEEILEIIEHNYIVNYALDQADYMQKIKERENREQERLRERVRNEGMLSEEEALRITKEKLREEVGELADNAVFMIWIYDQWHTKKAPLQYFVHGYTEYGEWVIRCAIRPEDGRFLDTDIEPDAAELLRE